MQSSVAAYAPCKYPEDPHFCSSYERYLPPSAASILFAVAFWDKTNSPPDGLDDTLSSILAGSPDCAGSAAYICLSSSARCGCLEREDGLFQIGAALHRM